LAGKPPLSEQADKGRDTSNKMLHLLLLHSFNSNVFAGAFDVAFSEPLSGGDASSTSTCEDQNDCKMKWSIVFNCVVAVIGSTYLAVHPNITYDEAADRKRVTVLGRYTNIGYATLRHIFICILVIVSPEFILAWALRQALQARKITQRKSGAVLWFPVFGLNVDLIFCV
jgi:hypothetical protein